MNRSPKLFQSKQYDRCYEKVKQRNEGSLFFSALFSQTAGRAAFFSRNYITLYIWNIAI